MPYQSRLNRIQEQKSSKKLAASVILTIVIFIVLLFWGIPLLIGMSSFLSGLNQPKEDTPKNQNPVFAPFLEPTFEATNSMPIQIKGYANTEGDIELYLNGDLYDTVLASSDGSFIFPQVILNDGPNKLWTKVSVDNKKSENSSEIVILYSKEKPDLEITSPEEGSAVSSENKKVAVSGSTQSGNAITINEHFIVVDPEGKFSYDLPLTDGDNIIKVTATDKAGNQTSVERTVKYSPPS